MMTKETREIAQMMFRNGSMPISGKNNPCKTRIHRNYLHHKTPYSTRGGIRSSKNNHPNRNLTNRRKQNE